MIKYLEFDLKIFFLIINILNLYLYGEVKILIWKEINFFYFFFYIDLDCEIKLHICQILPQITSYKLVLIKFPSYIVFFLKSVIKIDGCYILP